MLPQISFCFRGRIHHFEYAEQWKPLHLLPVVKRNPEEIPILSWLRNSHTVRCPVCAVGLVLLLPELKGNYPGQTRQFLHWVSSQYLIETFIDFVFIHMTLPKDSPNHGPNLHSKTKINMYTRIPIQFHYRKQKPSQTSITAKPILPVPSYQECILIVIYMTDRSKRSRLNLLNLRISLNLLLKAGVLQLQ